MMYRAGMELEKPLLSVDSSPPMLLVGTRLLFGTRLRSGSIEAIRLNCLLGVGPEKNLGIVLGAP